MGRGAGARRRAQAAAYPRGSALVGLGWWASSSPSAICGAPIDRAHSFPAITASQHTTPLKERARTGPCRAARAWEGGGSGGSTKRPCCAPLLAEICHGLNQLFSGIFCQKYASCAVAVSPIWQSRRSSAACNRRAIASGRCRALWMTNHMQWGEFRRPGNSSA